MRRPNTLKKVFKHLHHKNEKLRRSSNGQTQQFSSNIEENETKIKEQLGNSLDIVYRKFPIRYKNGDLRQALAFFIDGLSLEVTIRDSVLQPIAEEPFPNDEQNLLENVQERLTAKRISKEYDINKAIEFVLKGKLVLLIDGIPTALIVHIESFEFLRAVQEPEAERTVRGARDGFIESTAVNISLLRRRIAHPGLQFESLTIGEISGTTIVIAYIKGIVDPTLVNRVKKRLEQIKVDGIHSSGDIEQYIEDHPFSLFPTIGNTERTDQASAILLEGRILILTDGSPVVLYVPLLFLDNIKTIEDYNSRPYYSSFIRLIRFISFYFSTTLPALYFSALNFNKQMIPSDLLVPIIQAREMVPFSLWLEIALMILMFEVVREAGVRLPQAVGSALSIVGALILGQVAVSAGLVGAPTIVIISITYISAFIITPIADVTAMLRIGLLISSSLFGVFGLIVALLGLTTHMVSLTSMGVPYMAPIAPTHIRDFKDLVFRLPTKWLKHRPKSIPNQRDSRINSLPEAGDKQ